MVDPVASTAVAVFTAVTALASMVKKFLELKKTGGDIAGLLTYGHLFLQRRRLEHEA